MTLQTAFEKKSLHGVEFRLPEPDAEPALCPAAKPFAAWCGKLKADLGVQPNDIQVNLALLNLQTKFFGWHERAPPDCRKHFGARKQKVRCLFEVYRETFLALHDIVLALTPPRLREPPPPPPPVAVPQLAGITLGEILGDE